jgi:ABC-2 type transport system ATP-binding protein
MKQRLGIANALLSPRELLIMDEPTNGLDPQGTREVRSLVRSLAAGGTTVFVSSHLLAEVEQICSHAAVMSAGRLVAQGTLAELRRAGRVQLKVTTPDVGDAQRVLDGLGLDAIVGPPDGADGHLTAAFPVDAVKAEDIAAALVRDGIRLRGFTVEGSSLEERYVALTGEGFEVEH